MYIYVKFHYLQVVLIAWILLTLSLSLSLSLFLSLSLSPTLHLSLSATRSWQVLYTEIFFMVDQH